MACGGATSTSSIDSGFPASHATAAAIDYRQISTKSVQSIIAARTKKDTP